MLAGVETGVPNNEPGVALLDGVGVANRDFAMGKEGDFPGDLCSTAGAASDGFTGVLQTGKMYMRDILP